MMRRMHHRTTTALRWSRGALTAACGLVVLCTGAADARVPPIPKEKLAAAARYSAAHDGLALLVHQKGRLRLEEYRNGAKRGDAAGIYSISKSFWGVLALVAEKDGILRLDERVADTLTGWRDDPRRSAITVSDLLSMTSGLEPGYGVLTGDISIDRFAAAESLRAVEDRGAAFAYGPANMNVFGALLQRKLASRGTTPLDYLHRRLLRPLGIKPAEWATDAAGNPGMAGGARMTPRQLMRFGRMLLHGGRWHLRRIVPRDRLGVLWQGSPANPAYGRTFWLNRQAAQPDAAEVDVEGILVAGAPFDGWPTACFSRRAPPDTVVLLGSYNQRVYVIPSLDLVIVRTGRGTDFSHA